MVSKQTKKSQHQSVSPSSKEVVKKKIKMKVVEEKKVRSKSKRGQIKLAQSKKNQKQEDLAKPSIKELIEAAASTEESGTVPRLTRRRFKEGLQLRSPPSPAKSRRRKQVNSAAAAASEKPEKVQRRTRQKSNGGLQVRPSPPPGPAMSRRRKQALKFTSDNDVGVITDRIKIKRKEIKVGRKKRNLPVVGDGAGEVSGSQPKKKIEAEMIEEPQPEGKIQAVPVVVEPVSSGPSEKERGQDLPPSLARGKSQEERFDELKRFTPRRMNLLSRFTEISEKRSRDQASPSSSKPFLDSPEGGKVCQTCQEPRGEGRKLRSCSFCSTVVYCGEECQRKDWPNHKKDCWIVPGPGYKPKRLLKPVLVQEEPLSEEEVKSPKTPAKATAGGSSTPDNSPTLLGSIRSEVTRAPTSKRKSWKRRTLFGVSEDVDVDPLVATAPIRRKISFHDDLDDEVHNEAGNVPVGKAQKTGGGAAVCHGLRL